MNDAAAQGAVGSPPARQTLTPRLLRWIRRIHLYLGLLLWPFVLLFGLTGLSFNHPTVGRALTVRQVPAAAVASISRFQPWDAGNIAERVAQELRRQGKPFQVDGEEQPRFFGFPLFAAPDRAGKQVLILSLSDGSATITERPDPAPPPANPLAGVEVKLPGLDLGELAARLEPLLIAQGVASTGPLRPHPKVHPELRFRLRDASGREWNTRYDLATGALDAYPSSQARGGSLAELLEAIHTQHHYPPDWGATSLWALFADATALTLIVWALSGLIMWWQMRRLRKTGLVVVLVAVALSASVIAGTARELQFSGAPEQD